MMLEYLGHQKESYEWKPPYETQSKTIKLLAISEVDFQLDKLDKQ